MRQQGRAHGAASARPAVASAGRRTPRGRRPRAGPAPKPRTATPSSAETAGAAVLLALFLVSLLIPARIYMGDLLLSPDRIFLLLAFLPLFFRLVSGKAGPVRPVDIFIGLYCLWIALSIFIAHGGDRFAFIGITIVELFGGYLVGRTLVLGQKDYRAFFRYFFWAMLFLLPFVLIEQMTRRLLISEIIGLAFPTYPYVNFEQRMGLNRIQSVFEHPILFGLFWSVGIGNFYFLNRDRLSRALPLTGLAAFMTFMSLSSAPVLAGMLQFGMIVWEKVTGARWKLLALLGILAYIVVDLLSNRTPVEVLISYGTFNQGTAYNRVLIWNYGMENVMGSPIFGIGLNDWVRPWWMHSGSFDNFWLLQAMRYGIPAFVFLALAIAASIWSITRAQRPLLRREAVPHGLHGGADRAALHAGDGPCLGLHLGLLHVLHRRGRLDRPGGRHGRRRGGGPDSGPRRANRAGRGRRAAPRRRRPEETRLPRRSPPRRAASVPRGVRRRRGSGEPLAARLSVTRLLGAGLLAAALLGLSGALVLAGLELRGREIDLRLARAIETAPSALAPAAPPAWGDARPRVLVAGDSRVAAWAPRPDIAPARLVFSGIGGETSAELRRRLERDLREPSPPTGWSWPPASTT